MCLKIFWAPALCLLAAAPPAECQPAIRFFGVRNAASNQPADHGGPGLAQGSIFIVQGSGLGPQELLQAAPPYPARFPDEDGGTRITITPVETNVPIDAPLLYTWEWQVAGIVPPETPPGPADVTVSWRNETSKPVRIKIQPVAPGIFTQGMDGGGPGVIQNYIATDNQPLNSLTGPALPGQYLILWGTGLGIVNRWFDRDFEIELGGLYLRPAYAGPAPGQPGLDQINVLLPDDGSLPEGCYTELRVRAGEYTSPPVTVATAREPGPCKHPMNLSPETLARLDAGGRVPVADFSLSQTEFPGGDGFVSARLLNLTATELAGLTPGMTPTELPVGCSRSTGAIPTAIFRLGDFSPLPPPPDLPVPLNAGETLLLAGPGERSLAFTRDPGSAPFGGYVSEQPPPGFFTPGDWTISAPGGADTGSFTAVVTLSPVPQPEIPAVLDRTADFHVTWPTEGSAPHDFVTMTVSSYTRLDNEAPVENAAALRCVAPATTGAVTFPTALLQELRSLDNGQVSVNVTPAPDNWTTFSAPGIEYGKFTWSRQVYRRIEIQ